MNSEYDLLRYEQYIAFKANALSGDIATVALASVGLGLVDLPVATQSFELKEASNSTPTFDYKRELADITLRNTISIETSPKAALRHLSAHPLADAA